MPKRPIEVDGVDVSSSTLLAIYIPIANQVTKNPMGSPFPNPHQVSDFRNTNFRVLCHTNQHMTVVREEGPLPH